MRNPLLLLSGHKRPFVVVFLVASLTLCISSSIVSVLVGAASSSTLLRPHCGNDDSMDDDANSSATSPPRVTNFALIDVATNQTIVASLKDNFVLNLTSVQALCANGAGSSSTIFTPPTPPKLTIRVDAQGSVFYMVMDWDHGSTVRTSRRSPFALAGVVGGDAEDDAEDRGRVVDEKNKDHQQMPFFGHSHSLTTPGMHSLQATPFDWQGRAGRGRELHLQVILGGGSAAGVDALLRARTRQEAQAKRNQDDDSKQRVQQQQQQRPNNSFVLSPTENERRRQEQSNRGRNDGSSEQELPNRWNGNQMMNRKIIIRIIRRWKNETKVSAASTIY